MCVLTTVLLVCLLNLSGGNAFRAGSPDSRGFMVGRCAPDGYEPAVLCPEQGITTFPNHGRCETYYKCVEGVGELKECPSGLLYNPARENDTDPCDMSPRINISALYFCAPELQGLLPCPSEGMMTVAASAHCDKYYECVQGVLELRQCPGGLVYSDEKANDTQPCVHIQEEKMSTFLRCFPPPTELACLAPCSEDETTFADSGRCNGYFECVNGEPQYRECPLGLLYNPVFADDPQPCDSVYNLQVSRFLYCSLDLTEQLVSPPATTPPPPPPPPQMCYGEFRDHFPIEGLDHCRSYYECRGGEAIYRECPEGLIYDFTTKDDHFPCDYPENVYCISHSPPPPTPPTPSPSVGPPSLPSGYHHSQGSNEPRVLTLYSLEEEGDNARSNQFEDEDEQ